MIDKHMGIEKQPRHELSRTGRLLCRRDNGDAPNIPATLKSFNNEWYDLLQIYISGLWLSPPGIDKRLTLDNQAPDLHKINLDAIRRYISDDADDYMLMYAKCDIIYLLAINLFCGQLLINSKLFEWRAIKDDGSIVILGLGHICESYSFPIDALWRYGPCSRFGGGWSRGNNNLVQDMLFKSLNMEVCTETANILLNSSKNGYRVKSHSDLLHLIAPQRWQNID